MKEGCLLQSYAMWLGIDCMLVSVAALLCLIVEPVAAGGGIAEVCAWTFTPSYLHAHSVWLHHTHA